MSFTSRSSLTPIEDAEIDPLNASIFSDFRQGGVVQVHTKDRPNEANNIHVADRHDEQMQDISPRQQSETTSYTETTNINDIQRSDSAQASPLNRYRSGEDEERFQRRLSSGNSESAGGNGSRTSSVLMVRESPIANTLDTVDTFRPHGNDEEDVSSGSELNQSGNRKSPIENATLVASPTRSHENDEDDVSSGSELNQSGNRKSPNKHVTLVATPKDMNERIDLQSKSGQNESEHTTVRNGCAPVTPTSEYNTPLSPGVSGNSKYGRRYFSTESHTSGQIQAYSNNDINPDDMDLNVENKLSSSDLMNRTDSVENSYFATFEATEAETETKLKQSSDTSSSESTDSSMSTERSNEKSSESDRDSSMDDTTSVNRYGNDNDSVAIKDDQDQVANDDQKMLHGSRLLADDAASDNSPLDNETDSHIYERKQLRAKSFNDTKGADDEKVSSSDPPVSDKDHFVLPSTLSIDEESKSKQEYDGEKPAFDDVATSSRLKEYDNESTINIRRVKADDTSENNSENVVIDNNMDESSEIKSVASLTFKDVDKNAINDPSADFNNSHTEPAFQGDTDHQPDATEASSYIESVDTLNALVDCVHETETNSNVDNLGESCASLNDDDTDELQNSFPDKIGEPNSNDETNTPMISAGTSSPVVEVTGENTSGSSSYGRNENTNKFDSDNSNNTTNTDKMRDSDKSMENETKSCMKENKIESGAEAEQASADGINLPTVVGEPAEQEIEREPTSHVNSCEDIQLEAALNSSGNNSFVTKEGRESESESELIEDNEIISNQGTVTLLHVSKSSSTLSVKTASSSSSRISNATRGLKTGNKNLERLLKGPYSEVQKPPTPRPKGRQKSTNNKKKKTKPQEKTKSAADLVDRKTGSQKLRLHTTRNKTDNSRSNGKKTNLAGVKSASSEKKGKVVRSTVPVPLPPESFSMGKDTQCIASPDENQNKDTLFEENETEEVGEKNLTPTEPPSTQNSNELPPESKGEGESLKENNHSNDDKNQCEQGNLEEDDPKSTGLDSPGIHRSESLSKTMSEKKTRHPSIVSQTGKPAIQSPGVKSIGESKSIRQSMFMGKKKIIISSPKASEKLSAKEAKRAAVLTSNGSGSDTASTTSLQKGNPDLNRPLPASNGIANKTSINVESFDSVLTPTTITVIDETNDSPKTNTTAGRFILNNIKMNLKKKSLQKNSTGAAKASKRQSRSPSPEGNALSNSGQHKEGKLAYKTQSMSSLQVPGQPAAQNPLDPPREEDALSIYSRRHSMDSVSRKSVDYRIRNTATVIQPQAEEKPKSVFNNDETFIQNAIPCLPIGLAIICLILNTVLPGSGTALSGVSILCCGQSRLSNKEDQVLNTMCANLIVGLAQLLTVTFLLVGWFWSIGWGIKMVSISVKRRREIKQQREKDLQTLALSAFGSPKRLNGFGV